MGKETRREKMIWHAFSLKKKGRNREQKGEKSMMLLRSATSQLASFRDESYASLRPHSPLRIPTIQLPLAGRQAWLAGWHCE